VTRGRGIGPRRILDIQMRAREIGRIRLGGHKSAKTPGRPLEKFRFTSPNAEAIKYAAAAFGGTPQQWEDQWEVFSEVSEIEIGVPANIDPVSASYEDWTGGRCVKRCDGKTEWLSGEPCSCDPAARACKPTIRLSLLVPAIPIMGVWRLESHGWTANSELVPLVEFAQQVPGHVRGILRLERKSDRKEDPQQPGKTITRNYIVPVLDLHLSVAAVIAGGDVEPRRELPKPTRPELPPGPDPEPLPPRTSRMPDLPEGSVLDDGDDGDAKESGFAGFVADGDADEPKTITQAQRKRLFAIARSAGVADYVLRAIVKEERGDGNDSTADMPVEVYERVVERVERSKED
jgi:hypothetical protein